MPVTPLFNEQDADLESAEVQQLRQFDAFAFLPYWALIPLASAARFNHFNAGEQICAHGDEGNDEYFLLQGRVVLTAADGRTQEVEGNTPLSGKPLALLRPRKYEITCSTPCELLTLDQRYYRSYIKEITPLESEHMLQDDSSLYAQFQQDLNLRKVTLPTSPQLAKQLKQQLSQRPLSKALLGQLLMQSPTITTNIMRLANSPLFMHQGPCQEIGSAIDRLGMGNCAALIRAFGDNGTSVESSPALQELGQRLQRDAQEMAALCCVIARQCPGFNLETAALTGLLHNIGLMLVETYLHQSPQFADMFGDLEKVSRDLGSRIGHELLAQWQLPEPLCEAQSNLYNWNYHKRHQFDYSSLLICAQAHHHLMHPDTHKLPPLDLIPALRDLPCGAITPRQSIDIICQAKQQLEQFHPEPSESLDDLLLS